MAPSEGSKRGFEMFCFPPDPLARVRLGDDVNVRVAGSRASLVMGGETELTFHDPVAAELLSALDAGRTPRGAIADLAAAEERLLSVGAVCVEFLSSSGGEVVARLRSTGHGQALRTDTPAPRWRLHPQAVLWPEEDGWRLTHPLTRYELRLRNAAILDDLRAGGDAPGGTLRSLLTRASWAGALSVAPDATDAAQAWGREDLLFHTASRRRADHRRRGRRVVPASWDSPPALGAHGAPLCAELRLRMEGVSFESVLARRRSVRGELAPLAAEDLPNLLRVVQAARGGAPVGPHLAYPTAGGLHVLDFHVLGGAPPTLHRFDAAAGALVPIAAPPGSVQPLLDGAALSWGGENGTPQALLVITARLPMLTARYEAIAYRLALLEAGCATQVVTQAATALGIATCVLGSGDGELFAHASGLPEWQQPALVEIAIAGRLD